MYTHTECSKKINFVHTSKQMFSSQSSPRTSYSLLSLSLSVSPSPTSFFLHFSRLFIWFCLTVLIIAPALAQHALPNMALGEQMKKAQYVCVWEVVDEVREEDADRERQGRSS